MASLFLEGGKSILTAFFEWAVHWVSIEMAGCWLTKINVLTLHTGKCWRNRFLFLYIFVLKYTISIYVALQMLFLSKICLLRIFQTLEKRVLCLIKLVVKIFQQNTTKVALVSLDS